MLQFLAKQGDEVVQQGDDLPRELETLLSQALPNEKDWVTLSQETVTKLVINPIELRSVTLRQLRGIEVQAMPKQVAEALKAGLLRRLKHPVHRDETLGMESR